MNTNNLKYKVGQTVGKRRIEVNIRLSDDCGNEHNDFAITGTVYERQRDGSWEMTAGGCCHDEILKVYPEFRPFVDLHLCDAKGAPMYPDANGFYWLEQRDKRHVVKEQLRLTEQEYEVIKATASDQLCLKYLLYKMGIVARWERQAKDAISQLEALTGKTFVDDSKRYQLTPLTPEEFELIDRRMASGYYTPENNEIRRRQAAEEKRQKKINDLRESAAKDIQKIENAMAVKLHVLDCGLSIDNFIYYDHTNTGEFNWHSASVGRDEISREEFDGFLARVDYSKLPQGIKFNLNSRQ